jgi:hypothetical protein
MVANPERSHYANNMDWGCTVLGEALNASGMKGKREILTTCPLQLMFRVINQEEWEGDACTEHEGREVHGNITEERRGIAI